MSLHIDQIRIDGGTQSRAAINEATVAEYAEAMDDPNTVFPPVIVYHDGKEYWLADGFHRLAAWRRIGRTDIPTDIRQGDRRRAILHSVAANSAHGLRRTNEDKRRAVLTLLEDEEWGRWSDREIARRCAVHHDMVGKLRASLTGGSASEVRAYTTKHGTEAVMNTAKIGAASKPDQEEITPEATQFLEDAQEQASKELAPSKPDQEHDPHAAERRKLAKLTREALEDDLIGLRADLADERERRKKAEVENKTLKGRLDDLLADDRNEVIRRMQRELAHAQSERWRQQDETRRAMAQVHGLKKRVAELERMGVAL